MNIILPDAPENSVYRMTGGADVEPTIGEVAEARFEESYIRSPFTSALRWGELTLSKFDEDATQYTKDEWKDSQYYREDLSFPDGVNEETARIMAFRKDEENKRAEVMSRKPTNFGQDISLLAVDFAAQALDPLNVGSAFIPIAAGTNAAKIAATGKTLAARTVARAKVGALEGLVGNALVEPFVYASAKAEQANYGMADSFINTLMGAPIGAAFHIGVGGIKDLTPWAKHKALETSVGQLVDERFPEVGPIVETDKIYNENHFPDEGNREAAYYRLQSEGPIDQVQFENTFEVMDSIAVEAANRGLIETPDDFYRGKINGATLVEMDKLYKMFEGTDVNGALAKAITILHKSLDDSIDVKTVNRNIKKYIKAGKEYLKSGEAIDPKLSAEIQTYKAWMAILYTKVNDGSIKIQGRTGIGANVNKRIRDLQGTKNKLEGTILKHEEGLEGIEANKNALLADREGTSQNILDLNREKAEAPHGMKEAFTRQILDLTKRMKEVNIRLRKLDAEIVKRKSAGGVLYRDFNKAQNEIVNLSEKVNQAIANTKRSVNVSPQFKKAFGELLGDLPEAKAAKAERIKAKLENIEEPPNRVDDVEASVKIQEENDALADLISNSVEKGLDEINVLKDVDSLRQDLSRELDLGRISKEEMNEVMSELDSESLSKVITDDEPSWKQILNCALGEIKQNG